MGEADGGHRVKVLISAPACMPDWGSESGVGWNWVLAAARSHEVWVLTSARFRDRVEEGLAREGAPPTLHMVYYEPRLARLWHTGRAIRIRYLLWQLGVYRIARRLHRREQFDVVHHITLMSIEWPGVLFLLRAPFVWGPVGGAQGPPPSLRRYYDGRGWLSERLRGLRKRLVRFHPLLRLAARRASTVIVVNAETEKVVRQLGARELRPYLDIVIGGDELPEVDGTEAPTSMPRSGTFTVLWAGSLIGRKAPTLALDVFASLLKRGVAARLVMIGDGPLRDSVAERVRELGLSESVELRGQIPHAELLQEYKHADAFLYSSLSDTSGAVSLEAMANGVPVVALDHQGVARIVTPESGELVPVSDADTVVAGLAAALESLATDPERWERLSAGARQRVTDFSRDRCAALLDELYSRAAAGAHPT